jgi:Na+/H+-translocating membrane pyrophosphatase
MLLGGYLRNAGLDSQTAEDAISLTDPYIFSGMLIGGVLPFALSGLVARGSRKAVAPLIQ